MRKITATPMFLMSVMIVLISVDTLTIPQSTPPRPQNSRYVCLFDDYLTIKGPYFNALLSQILQDQAGIQKRKIALCTCQVNAERISSQLLPQIHQDLLLEEDDRCALIVLDDYNPITLQDKLCQQLEPTIIWVVDDNAFRLRYRMKTSGLDKIIEQMCGDGPDTDTTDGVLYIGQDAGAICAGASLTTAYALDHDPKQAQEPQFFGMELLGSKRSVSFGISKQNLKENPKIKSMEHLIEGGRNCNHEFLTFEYDQIFVWSQPPEQEVTSFVFLPCQRGGMEQLTSPPPVPPLVDYETDGMGGVQCYGEPAIDPSRMMQEVGDSEWINEAE